MGSAAYYAAHREEIIARNLAYRKRVGRSKRGPRALASRRRLTLARYGLTPEAYDAMLTAQEGVCAICRRPERYRNKTLLAVDHDHRTDRVRGLLCHGCNLAVGLLADDPESLARLAAYLTLWGAVA